jgi:hypothetical protein
MCGGKNSSHGARVGFADKAAKSARSEVQSLLPEKAMAFSGKFI